MIKDDSSRTIDAENHSSCLTVNSLPLNGLQILVVDDDADSLDFVAFVLEQDGAEVIGVSSALAAIQMLSHRQIDVLISDISMPEMDGYMLMRQVRGWRAEQGGKIPAIALTAYAGEYEQKQAITAGFDLHLSKPIAREDLVQAIAQVINSPQS